jgi:hypothetical protein
VADTQLLLRFSDVVDLDVASGSLMLGVFTEVVVDAVRMAYPSANLALGGSLSEP